MKLLKHSLLHNVHPFNLHQRSFLHWLWLDGRTRLIVSSLLWHQRSEFRWPKGERTWWGKFESTSQQKHSNLLFSRRQVLKIWGRHKSWSFWSIWTRQTNIRRIGNVCACHWFHGEREAPFIQHLLYGMDLRFSLNYLDFNKMQFVFAN